MTLAPFVPTPEQDDAVTAPPAPMLLVAGAGTGKTSVMAERILWLIRSGKATPDQILGLTFTNKAAANLKKQVLARVKGDADVTVATYHSFGASLVADHALELDLDPGTQILNRAQSWQLLFAVFDEWTGIQLLNKWYVLLIVYPTLTVPFCTWIMIGYFASIPKELDEAALIDGASWLQTLTRIFIPVALPGLIAATIFAFTVSWAQFLYPLVFTTSIDQLVLPVGITTTLIKGDVFNWGQIMTGALLGAAPPLVIYAFLMDYYIAGLTAGATKG